MGARFQQQVFNKSLAEVEKANRELIVIYDRAQQNIEKKMALLRLQIEKGLYAEARADRLIRMNKFLASLKKDIVTLKTRQQLIMTDGFITNYQNAYYGYGYDISKTVNTQILDKVGFDYSLGYRKLNIPYINRLYSEEIAGQIYGLGIKERTAQEILRVQAGVRQQVTQAIVEGISPKQLVDRLAQVDAVFEQNKRHAFTVARTELLKGHNIGAEEAILTAQDAGVVGTKIWNATLDGKTRATHAAMDSASRAGTQPDDQGFFTFPDGSSAQMPHGAGLSAAEAVNCRCNVEFAPYGVSPNKRGSRLANGRWKVLNKDLSYQEWGKTLEGRESIKATEAARRKRAAKLAKSRATQKRPTIENVALKK